MSCIGDSGHRALKPDRPPRVSSGPLDKVHLEAVAVGHWRMSVRGLGIRLSSRGAALARVRSRHVRLIGAEMRGQYLGQATSDAGASGNLWTVVDADRNEGYAIFTQAGRQVVGAITGLDQPHRFSLVREQGLGAILGLDTLPEGSRVDVVWAENEDGKIGGSYRLSEPDVAPSEGKFELVSLAPRLSNPNLRLSTWAECKTWMDSHRHSGPSLYRGQSRPLPMVSSFHRTGRSNLLRFINHDLQVFADHASTYSGRVYRWSDLTDRGAVLALAQHHGFPTPLIDWSWSPYVSAYFAFAGVVEALPARGGEPVRMFRLTPDFLADHPASPETVGAGTFPHVQQFHPASMGNTRLLAQQGAMLFSNVPSPETFIRMLESRAGKTYLEVVDMPSTIAREALSDLRRMGVTAAMLFPGLDGVASALKHQLFFS